MKSIYEFGSTKKDDRIEITDLHTIIVVLTALPLASFASLPFI
jgi:hypothetical protein